MVTPLDHWTESLEREGFTLLPGVFSPQQVESMLAEWTDALEQRHGAAKIQSQSGVTCAARNVLQLWPAVAHVWRQPPLPEVLSCILGPDFGLVRVLYFDKPPGQTWALPWHKDLTLAVRDHSQHSPHFSHPTRKAGVPHVEGPVEVLENMLTARIHLDDMTEANGPLKVIPGSHRRGKAPSKGDVAPQSILGRRGDVLLLRPLLEHSSGRSHPEVAQHRRVLHLEFAASAPLPDGYEWFQFVQGTPRLV